MLKKSFRFRPNLFYSFLTFRINTFALSFVRQPHFKIFNQTRFDFFVGALNLMLSIVCKACSTLAIYPEIRCSVFGELGLNAIIKKKYA